MPKLTVRKSGRPTKPTQKRKTRSVSPLAAKPAKKRVKPARFIHPHQMLTAEESEEEVQSPAPPPPPVPVKDVSAEVFTVDKSCLLDKEVVWGDADFVCLGEFSYREFHQQTVRKVSKTADAAKKEFEWVSGQAKITSGKAKIAETISIEVEDEQGWKKVEQGVERWMREKNKGAVTVRLSVVYKSIRTSNTDDSENESQVIKKVFLKQCH